MTYLNRKKVQQTNQGSFVGGKPLLPAEVSIPKCRLCGNLETFFFQVALASESAWDGKTVSCFSCIKCANREFLIPEMLNMPLRGCNIPKAFLTSYQRNFSFLVFSSEAAQLVKDYEEQVEFFVLQRTELPGDFGKVGGIPNWTTEDETPSVYDSDTPMVYLFELSPGLEFNIVRNAPAQVELDLVGSPSPSPMGVYQLFLGNAIYLFGTTGDESFIYAITQVG